MRPHQRRKPGTGYGGHFLRPHRDRWRAGRLCRRDPRGAARHEGGGGRERASRRHLPQLGLHPDQGAAALGRDLALDPARRRLRLHGQGRDLRPEEDRRALAQGGEAALERRRLPAEEEQGRGVRRLRQAGGRAGRRTQGRRHEGRQAGRGSRGKARHPRHRRAGAHAAGAGARRQAGLDLQGSDGSGQPAEVAAGRRLGRDRHRIRELLPHAGHPR